MTNLVEQRLLNRTKAQISRQQNRGFSLVEMLVVTAILTAIAVMAKSRFERFKAKARQAQAKTLLSHLYSLEHAYHTDNNVFSQLPMTGRIEEKFNCNANNLGFRLTPCPDERIVYGFKVENPTAATFKGEAISGTHANNKIVKNCPNPDSWSVDQEKLITHVQDARSVCK